MLASVLLALAHLAKRTRRLRGFVKNCCHPTRKLGPFAWRIHNHCTAEVVTGESAESPAQPVAKPYQLPTARDRLPSARALRSYSG